MKMSAFGSGNASFSFSEKTAKNLTCFFSPHRESILWEESHWLGVTVLRKVFFPLFNGLNVSWSGSPQLVSVKQMWQLNQDEWAVSCQWRDVTYKAFTGSILLSAAPEVS